MNSRANRMQKACFMLRCSRGCKKRSFMKAMTRQQIACCAGVTVKTLSKWMKPYRKELEALGLRPGMIVLPPVIVKYICDKFCIDIPP